MLYCDWSQYDALTSAIESSVAAGKRVVEPFGYQAVSKSVSNLKRCAEIYSAETYPQPAVKLWSGERYGNSKIRLGYLSGEFRHQATSILMAGVFEAHDKDRFELFAFDNGGDDGSELRRRINSAFDHIVAIDALNDIDAAKRIKSCNIDILVNLNGFFGLSRTGVFGCRPAPIQVNYLGFPGTMGVDYIDYILGDRFVTPFDHAAFYSERIVQLPETYQANDAKRVISSRRLSRSEFGLPEQGFVFCCFNNSYKILPEVFDVWMRLLRKVDGSVLWLFEGNLEAVANLRREAERRFRGATGVCAACSAAGSSGPASAG
jgi:predicted O-linked N-acetylglucosamine transferase (SPINDLY family)